MKDMGPISYFLGIQFHQTEEEISMDQSYYLKSILKKFKKFKKTADQGIHHARQILKHTSQTRMTWISKIQLLVAIAK